MPSARRPAVSPHTLTRLASRFGTLRSFHQSRNESVRWNLTILPAHPPESKDEHPSVEISLQGAVWAIERKNGARRSERRFPLRLRAFYVKAFGRCFLEVQPQAELHPAVGGEVSTISTKECAGCSRVQTGNADVKTVGVGDVIELASKF